MIFDCNYINDKGSNQLIKRQRAFDTQPAEKESRAQALMATPDEVQPHGISL